MRACQGVCKCVLVCLIVRPRAQLAGGGGRGVCVCLPDLMRARVRTLRLAPACLPFQLAKQYQPYLPADQHIASPWRTVVLEEARPAARSAQQARQHSLARTESPPASPRRVALRCEAATPLTVGGAGLPRRRRPFRPHSGLVRGHGMQALFVLGGAQRTKRKTCTGIAFSDGACR